MVVGAALRPARARRRARPEARQHFNARCQPTMQAAQAAHAGLTGLRQAALARAWARAQAETRQRISAPLPPHRRGSALRPSFFGLGERQAAAAAHAEAAEDELGSARLPGGALAAPAPAGPTGSARGGARGLGGLVVRLRGRGATAAERA